jgi:hypothetical protein
MAHIKAPSPGKIIKGGPIPSQNLHIDPRGKTSYRAEGSYIAQGEKVTVKGTKTRKKQTATWF